MAIMNKLLRTNFFRLIKNKIFWGIVIITLGIASVLLFNTIINNQGETKEGIDRLLVMYMFFIGIAMAMFTSLFMGTEYSDGILRNKIVIGYSRKDIYLADLITSIIVGLCIQFIYMLIVAIIGIPILGTLQMTVEKFLFIILDIVFIIITYASIFTCITLLCSDITISTVSCMILVLIMFIASMALSSTANAMKYDETYIQNENGEIEVHQNLNPDYPGDLKKNVAKTILYCLPTGQTSQIISQVSKKPFQITNYMSDNELKTAFLYSLGVTIIITGVGMYSFKRKDLK